MPWCQFCARWPLVARALSTVDFTGRLNGPVAPPRLQRITVGEMRSSGVRSRSAQIHGLIRSGSRIWNRVSCARPAASAAPTSGLPLEQAARRGEGLSVPWPTRFTDPHLNFVDSTSVGHSVLDGSRVWFPTPAEPERVAPVSASRSGAGSRRLVHLNGAGNSAVSYWTFRQALSLWPPDVLCARNRK